MLTQCLLCQKHIAAGERRFSHGSGWICFTCGQETRGDLSYAAADFMANPQPVSKPLHPRQRNKLILTIAASAAAIIGIPATAIWMAYWLAVPAPQVASTDILIGAAPVGAAASEQSAIDLPLTPPTAPTISSPVTRSLPALSSPAAPAAVDSIAVKPAEPDVSPSPAGAAGSANLPSPELRVVVQPPAPAPAAPALPAAPPLVTRPTPPSPPTPERTSPVAESPLDVARRRLMAGDLRGANEQYSKVIRADVKDQRALVGRAIATYFAGSSQPAMDQLEDMHSRKPSRLVSFNLASMHYARNTLRSARVLHDYMRDADVLDEAAFDYFTLALWQSQWTARKSIMFWEMVRYHELYEQRLRLARGTDERKWGMTWVKPEDMREKLDKLREARALEKDQRQDVRELVQQRRALTAAIVSDNSSSGGLDGLNREITSARMRLYAARTHIGAMAPPMPSDIPVMLP